MFLFLLLLFLSNFVTNNFCFGFLLHDYANNVVINVYSFYILIINIFLMYPPSTFR